MALNSAQIYKLQYYQKQQQPVISLLRGSSLRLGSTGGLGLLGSSSSGLRLLGSLRLRRLGSLGLLGNLRLRRLGSLRLLHRLLGRLGSGLLGSRLLDSRLHLLLHRSNLEAAGPLPAGRASMNDLLGLKQLLQSQVDPLGGPAGITHGIVGQHKLRDGLAGGAAALLHRLDGVHHHDGVQRMLGGRGAGLGFLGAGSSSRLGGLGSFGRLGNAALLNGRGVGGSYRGSGGGNGSVGLGHFAACCGRASISLDVASDVGLPRISWTETFICWRRTE
jgi:hypothetical protein